jgi:hypothetical protein
LAASSLDEAYLTGVCKEKVKILTPTTKTPRRFTNSLAQVGRSARVGAFLISLAVFAPGPPDLMTTGRSKRRRRIRLSLDAPPASSPPATRTEGRRIQRLPRYVSSYLQGIHAPHVLAKNYVLQPADSDRTGTRLQTAFSPILNVLLCSDNVPEVTTRFCTVQ